MDPPRYNKPSTRNSSSMKGRNSNDPSLEYQARNYQLNSNQASCSNEGGNNTRPFVSSGHQRNRSRSIERNRKQDERSRSRSKSVRSWSRSRSRDAKRRSDSRASKRRSRSREGRRRPDSKDNRRRSRSPSSRDRYCPTAKVHHYRRYSPIRRDKSPSRRRYSPSRLPVSSRRHISPPPSKARYTTPEEQNFFKKPENYDRRKFNSPLRKVSDRRPSQSPIRSSLRKRSSSPRQRSPSRSWSRSPRKHQTYANKSSSRGRSYYNAREYSPSPSPSNPPLTKYQSRYSKFTDKYRPHTNHGKKNAVVEIEGKNVEKDNELNIQKETERLAHEASLKDRLPTETVLLAWPYEQLSQIGEGTYGQVYKAFDTSRNRWVAMKKIRMENEKEGFPVTATREIQLLKQLEGASNIVQLLDVKRQGESNIFLIFEYLSYDLSAIIGHSTYKTLLNDFAWIRGVLYQTLIALKHLHGRGILHRDLKASNLLMNCEGLLKVADFGLARNLDRFLYANTSDTFEEESDAFQGKVVPYLTNRVITLWYRSPELLLGASAYGPQVDIWAIGCLALELLLGKHPFPGNSDISQLEYIYKVMGTPPSLHKKAFTGSPTEKLSHLTNDTILPEYYLRQYAGPLSLQDCPWANMLVPVVPMPCQLENLIENNKPGNASPEEISLFRDIVERLLTFEPKDRISAKEALSHAFFKPFSTSEVIPPLVPLPNELSGQDFHEYTMKVLRKQKLAAATQSTSTSNPNTMTQ